MKKYIFHSGNRNKIRVERRAQPESLLLLRSPRSMEVFMVLLLVVKAWVLAYKYLESPEDEDNFWKRRALTSHNKAYKAMHKAEDRIDWNGRVSWCKAVLWLCRDTLDNLLAALNPMIKRVSPSYAEWVQLRKEGKPENLVAVSGVKEPAIVARYAKAGYQVVDAAVIPVGSGPQTGQGGSEATGTRDAAGSSQG